MLSSTTVIIVASLFLLFPRPAYSQPLLPKVLFTYQSQNIPFVAWCESLTLCFAPLIAHVIGGVQSPTMIGDSSKAPSWHAYLPHFNPISVAWRWNAIAYRRMRARDWDEMDLAACNAVFWDGDYRRWDGGEQIMVRSRAWLYRAPATKHVALLSASVLTSLVLAIQGVQACFVIFARLIPHTEKLASYNFGDGLPYIFIPIGCMGLLRLPAALWLTGDYEYSTNPQLESSDNSHVGEAAKAIPTEEKGATAHLLYTDASKQAISVNNAPASITMTRTTTSSTVAASLPTRLHSPNTVPALAFRAYWLISMLGILVGSAVACNRGWWGLPPSAPYISTTKLLFDSMYFFLTAVGALITAFYLLTGQTDATIIPCIHTAWYKLFTLIWLLAAFATVVVACLETRQMTSAPSTTTFPEFTCGNGTVCLPAAPGKGNANL